MDNHRSLWDNRKYTTKNHGRQQIKEVLAKNRCVQFMMDSRSVYDIYVILRSRVTINTRVSHHHQASSSGRVGKQQDLTK